MSEEAGVGVDILLTDTVVTVESDGANRAGSSKGLAGTFLAFLAFLASFRSAFSAFFCSLVEVPPPLLLFSPCSLCAFLSFLSFFAFLGLSCFLLLDSAFEWWSFLECSFLLELLEDSDLVVAGCAGEGLPNP